MTTSSTRTIGLNEPKVECEVIARLDSSILNAHFSIVDPQHSPQSLHFKLRHSVSCEEMNHPPGHQSIPRLDWAFIIASPNLHTDFDHQNSVISEFRADVVTFVSTVRHLGFSEVQLPSTMSFPFQQLIYEKRRETVLHCCGADVQWKSSMRSFSD
jgi:hypothetical protein